MSDTSAHREMKKAEPRPTQLVTDSHTIQEQVRMMDTQDTYKVYVKDWLHKHTGSAEECNAVFAEKFEGRVEDGDWKIEPPFDGSRYAWLQLRLWNVAGEYKQQDHAEESVPYVMQQFGVPAEDVRVVGRNSRDEVLLNDYGVKKLVRAATTLRGSQEPAQAE